MAELSPLQEAVIRQYKGISFEELNAMYDDENDPMSMDMDEYFDDMDLTDSQKKDRKESADKLKEIFELLIMMVFYYYVDGVYDYANVIAEAQESYENLVRKSKGQVSDYFMSAHIPNSVAGIVNTMLNNPGNPFNFSIDRVTMIAENEANSMWNDADFVAAVNSGKTRKTWHTIIDRKTRDWHAEVNGQTKPIMEPFIVDGELLQFPRDESLGASGGNIVNCRCSVSYS